MKRNERVEGKWKREGTVVEKLIKGDVSKRWLVANRWKK